MPETEAVEPEVHLESAARGELLDDDAKAEAEGSEAGDAEAEP